MLHFRAVNASVRGRGNEASCLSVPPVWRHLSLSTPLCSPVSFSGESSDTVTADAAMNIEQNAGDFVGSYERLVGMEFIGSSYVPISSHNALFVSENSVRGEVLSTAAVTSKRTATLLSSSSLAGDEGGGMDGELVTSVYFFLLIVASYNGKDTSIDALRCAFCGNDDDDYCGHGNNNSSNSSSEYDRSCDSYMRDMESQRYSSLDAGLLDREPDLLLQHLWGKLHGDARCVWHSAESMPLSPNAQSSSSSLETSSPFYIIDSTPLLLYVGLLDIVQASLTVSISTTTTAMMTQTLLMMMKEEGDTSLKHFHHHYDFKNATNSGRTSVSQQIQTMSSDYGVLLLSFTERLDAQKAMVAMSDPCNHERRSFVNIHHSLRSLEKRAGVTSSTTHSRCVLKGATTTTRTKTTTLEALDMAPYRYFVWLHVVGTDIFHEATLTKKIKVSFFTSMRGAAPRSCAVGSGSVASPGNKENNSLNVTERPSKEKRDGEVEGAGEGEGDPLGKDSSMFTLVGKSIGDAPSSSERGKHTVVRLPANAFCQMGYFLRRKATEPIQEGKKKLAMKSTTFYWISACDYTQQGLRVMEVRYIQEGDVSCGRGSLYFPSWGDTSRSYKSRQRKEGRRHREKTRFAMSLLGKLEVRSAAQWSLAQYPQWHHWDPVTQRLSFWAGFRTYDKLRVVAFNGHPDERCCEFEWNLPRVSRRYVFSTVPSDQHNAAAQTVSTIEVKRGFGVSGSQSVDNSGSGSDRGVSMCEPWGAACCSASSRIHMNLLHTQYEDGVRDYVLCEQLFLSPHSSKSAVSVGILTEGVKGGVNVNERMTVDKQIKKSVTPVKGSLPLPKGESHMVDKVTNDSASHEDLPLPLPTHTSALASTKVKLGPPAIICVITALRNYADTVYITIPLTFDERCRTAYNTPVSFLFMNGLIAIYLPGVFVHYVDVSHKDAPPRYLFGVRLYHPVSFSSSSLVKTKIGPLAATIGTPLVSYLPVPLGRWLYVPGTVMLFEASLCATSVWRFVRRCLLRQRLCRVQACGIYTAMTTKTTSTGTTAIAGDIFVDGEKTRSSKIIDNDEHLTRYLTSDLSESEGERKRHNVYSEPQILIKNECGLMDPALLATSLHPAPLHNAIHVALTHLQPQCCDDDEKTALTRLFLLSQNSHSSALSLLQKGQFFPSTSSSSFCLDWEKIWDARDVQLGNIFCAFLTEDTWQDISVELLATLIISESYERTRTACRCSTQAVPNKLDTKDNSLHDDTFAGISSISFTSREGLCNPYYVHLPLWDATSLAAEEQQYRREVALFYRSWRQQTQRIYQQPQCGEENVCGITSIGLTLHTTGCGEQLLDAGLQSSFMDLVPPRLLTTTQPSDILLRRSMTSSSTTLSDLVKDNVLPPPDHLSPPLQPSQERQHTNTGRHEQSEKRSHILSALLVQAASTRDAAVARQQCHNSIPEWWLCRGIDMCNATQLSLSAPPHTRLLFTPNKTLDTDNASKSPSLLRRLMHTFFGKRSDGGGDGTDDIKNKSHYASQSPHSLSAASMMPVIRLQLSNAFKAASLGLDSVMGFGNESCSDSNSLHGCNSSPNFTPSSTYVTNATTSGASAHSRSKSNGSINPKSTSTLCVSTQSAAMSGNVHHDTGGASPGPLLTPKPLFLPSSLGMGTRVPFDGSSCGTPFAEAVLGKLRLLVRNPSCSPSSFFSSTGGLPQSAFAEVRQQKQQQQQSSGVTSKSQDVILGANSRFLTPASASSFASLWGPCTTSTTGIAAQLTLVALLYDAAVASVVHTLVRIVNLPTVDSDGLQRQSSKAIEGDASGFSLTRWSFMQKLLLALERLGVPPSPDLAEGIARGGALRFSPRVFTTGQQCGAFEGQTLTQLLHHKPELADMLQEQVTPFLPQTNCALGFFSDTTARSIHDIVTPREEQAMTKAIQRVLKCDNMNDFFASVTMARTSLPSQSGYSDESSPVLSLQASYLPESQERMLLCRLVANASTSPRQISVNDIKDAVSHTALLREEKLHVMFALDPGPYLQSGDKRYIPFETDFASPFLPFQWWWKQKEKKYQHEMMHQDSRYFKSAVTSTLRVSPTTTNPSNMGTFPLLLPSSAKCHYGICSTTEFQTLSRHEEMWNLHLHFVSLIKEGQKTDDGGPLLDSSTTAGEERFHVLDDALPFLAPVQAVCAQVGGDNDNNSSNSDDIVHILETEREENRQASTLITMALVPQLLTATPLGHMVAKKRAKAAMAVALEPFFKNN